MVEKKPLHAAVDQSPHLMGMHQCFSDFDLLADTARGWNLETYLLQSGGFLAEALQIVDPTMGYQVSRAMFKPPIRQTGGPPPGLRTICVPVSEAMRLDWRNQLVSGNDILVFPANSELSAVTQRDFNMYFISVSEALLAGEADSLAYHIDSILNGTQEVFHCRPNDLTRVRKHLHNYEDAYQQSLDRQTMFTLLREAIRSVIRAIQFAGENEITRLPRFKEKAVRIAEQFIREHARDVPPLSVICRKTGASDRTLEQGFRESFGVTPKAYMQSFRLNEVRRGLIQGSPAITKISDAANEWGFWHMGQFAADYRSLFGELPSQTLCRTRG